MEAPQEKPSLFTDASQTLDAATIQDMIRQETNPLTQIAINNKQGLYEYLQNDFSKLFFTQGKYVQQQFLIVGPVRLRAHKTNRIEPTCLIVSDHQNCYLDSMIDENLNKTDVDGVKFSTCEEIN